MVITPEKNIYLPNDYIPFEYDPAKLNLTSRQLEEYENWAKFVQWGRKNPVLFAEQIFGLEFMDYQRYVFMMSWNTPSVVWCCSRGSGKALSLDTRIPTPNGDKTMREIQVGDFVYDENGKPTKVTNISPVFRNHDCYKVTFSDGEEIIADANHLWEVTLRSSKKKEIISTKEMYDNYLLPPRKNSKTWNDNWKEHRYSVPLSKPVEKTQKELPIDPYILGIWLGDGFARDGIITSSKKDYQDLVKCIEERGYIVSSVTNDSGNNKRLRIADSLGTPLKTLLKENDLYMNKHIPEEYLEASIEQRADLLAGLLDTDGYISKDGRNICEFVQSDDHKNIIDSVSHLLTSLGIKHQIKPSIKKCNGKSFESFRITFRLNNSFDFFRLPRKKKLLTDYFYNPSWIKSIIKVEQVDSVPTKCIMVDSPSHLYLCGEKNTVTHNSMLGSIFIMTKTLLIPNHTSYILCGVGSQSIELFTKIEKFVMRQIPSFATLTDVYQGEVVKNQANSNGFVHNPASYHFGLYNGSEVYTLNGSFDNNRSKRSNLNFYDEAAFVGNEELFTTSEPFCTQNSKFKLGQGVSDKQLKSEPHPFHNQLIYASSAGRTDQYFFRKYREASIHMDAGDKNFFCADINSDMVVHATKHGVGLTEALLTQEIIDSRMREDKESGLREYGNIFTSEGGDGQIIRRADIIRNSYPYIPVLNNKSEHKYVKFGISYDPARSHDNSVVTIVGFYQDERGIWNGDIVNMISLADLLKKSKTPMSTPNQIKALKGIIADYVPAEDLAYDALEYLFVDAGSGGAGVPITDFLCEDWTDKNGNKRRGLIDPEYNEGDEKRFPNAVKDKLKLISPSKYKSEMFEAMIKMIDTRTLHFTEEYMNKGSIELIYETDAKGRTKQRMTYPSEKEEEEFKDKHITVTTQTYFLTGKEELALKQIDMAKTELVNIYRFKQSSGKDRFDLAPEKANKLHDDRAYTVALVSWMLSLMQRDHIINKKKPKEDPKKFFKIRPPKKVTLYS